MGSRSLNKVMIIGNVGSEPRVASTNTGVPVCTFSVATNRSWLPRGATERREEMRASDVIALDKRKDTQSTSSEGLKSNER